MFHGAYKKYYKLYPVSTIAQFKNAILPLVYKKEV